MATFEEVIGKLDEDAKSVINTHMASLKVEPKTIVKSDEKTEAILGKIKARLGVEDLDDTSIDGLLTEFEAKQTSDQKLKTLERRIEAERKAREEAEGKVKNLSRAQLERSRDESVLSALGKIGVRPEAMAMARKLIATESEVDAGGAWTFGGLDMESFIGNFAKDHPYLLANPTRQGTTTQGQIGEKKDGFVFYTKEQYEAMSRSEQIRNAADLLKSSRQWK